MATIFTEEARAEMRRLLFALVDGRGLVYSWDWMDRDTWALEMEGGFRWVPYHELNDRQRENLDAALKRVGGHRVE